MPDDKPIPAIDFRWKIHAAHARERGGPGGVGSAVPTLTKRKRSQEDHAMADLSLYTPYGAILNHYHHRAGGVA